MAPGWFFPSRIISELPFPRPLALARTVPARDTSPSGPQRGQCGDERGGLGGTNALRCLGPGQRLKEHGQSCIVPLDTRGSGFLFPLKSINGKFFLWNIGGNVPLRHVNILKCPNCGCSAEENQWSYLTPLLTPPHHCFPGCVSVNVPSHSSMLTVPSAGLIVTSQEGVISD